MTLRPKIADYIVDIIARLQDSGFEAYIVGGAVRDFLLERQPKDYDLSTSATPEQIRKVFRDRHCMIIGRRFRLVHLYHGKDITEISTFRRCPTTRPAPCDLPKRAAAAPENMIFQDNEFGTSEEDAWRRDFTINAIFYDPVHDKLIDYTGMGLKDVASRTVRIIGDAELRFEEDPVRLLRALKLVGQYGFSMDDVTGAALRKQLPLIVHAAPSRMTLELEKILKNPYGDAILRTFREYGFLKYFLPAIDAVYDSPQAEYAFRLLAKRNERLRSGVYRDSLSLAISILTLPFAELRFENNPPGGLWQFFPEAEDRIKDLIQQTLAPHAVTKRSLAAAIRTLLFQTRLKSGDSSRYAGQRGYPSARELAVIQNQVLWNISGFEENCSLPDPSMKQRSRRPRHRSRRRHRAAAEAAVINTEAASL